MAVNDAALREVVRGELDVDSIPGENPDAMPAQAAGDVREHDVTVV
jgi:hypothetical protein